MPLTQITITNEKGRLTADQIEKMVAEAARFAEQDEIAHERTVARLGLENYAAALRKAVAKEAKQFNDGDMKSVQAALEGAAKWLSAHGDAKKEDFEERQQQLETDCDAIMKRLFGVKAPSAGASSSSDSGSSDAIAASGDLD